MSRELVEPNQPPLWKSTHVGTGTNTTNFSEAFRRLYYHLYSNSDASRAERIMADLALILLLKLSMEVSDSADKFFRYQSGEGSANDYLIPVLHETFPQLLDAQDRFTLGDNAIRLALRDLQGINLLTAPAHILGDAFQAIMGPRLRGDKGQFFTPRSLVRAMVEVIAPEPRESILDPACGTGGFLAESHAYRSARSGSEDSIGHLVGIDKDHDLSRLAAALLQIATGGKAIVMNLNSLDLRQWRKQMEIRNDDLFDVVLTNPPFGARIGVRDHSILKDFDLGHQWVKSRGEHEWHKAAAVSSYQDPQTLFLELCVRKLKPGGRLGIVLPEGIFGNRKQGYIWEWLRSQGQIFGLLDCPRTTFQPGTDTKTNVLFFRKFSNVDETQPSATAPVRIAVALHCGHDRRGRSHLSNGRPYPDDFARLGKQFHKLNNAESGWRDVVLTHPDYLVPRYYIERGELSPQEAALVRGAPTATLLELVESKLLNIRKGHEVGSDVYGSGNVPFVRTSDISNFEISADPTNGVSEETYMTFAKQQQLQPGDILLVVDGRYRIGSAAILTENNYRCVVQSHFRILTAEKPNELDPWELLFALNLPSTRLRIRDLVFVQSTLGTLGKRLYELKIPILHGDGPWTEQIQRFQQALKKRDQLLAEMKAMRGPEYEL